MNLQQWREQKKKTQAAAAEHFGIPQPTISRIERGDIFPSGETVTILVEGSGGCISADDLHANWRNQQEQAAE